MRTNFTTLWIADHHLLQTHTCALARLTEEQAGELGLVGIFKTISQGNNPGSPNCFLFPLPNGAWKVYRFSQGINEADTWSQDGEGWTTCYFNRTPDLAAASKAHGGLEDPDKEGQYVFNEAALAIKAAEALGEKIELMDEMMDREARLKTSKSGRLAVEIEKQKDDNPKKMPGWIDKKDKWVRIFEVKTESTKSDELGFREHDHLMRELVAASKEVPGGCCSRTANGYGSHPATSRCSCKARGSASRRPRP